MPDRSGAGRARLIISTTEPGDVAGTAPGSGSTPEDEKRLAEQVAGAVRALTKAGGATQLYAGHGPVVERFLEELRDRLTELWSAVPHVTLGVGETSLHWREHVVYSEEAGTDNLAFLLFRDGIRLLAFLPGVESGELGGFLETLHLGRQEADESDDLLLRLWHSDFDYIRFEYSAMVGDEGDGAELPEPRPGRYGDRQLVGEEEVVRAQQRSRPAATEARPSLPFAATTDLQLEDEDLEALRNRMEREWERPLVRDVFRALLDQIELRGPDRLQHVLDILEEEVPARLQTHHWGEVAYLLRDMEGLERNRVAPGAAQKLREFRRAMSPRIVEALTRADDPDDRPSADERGSLLARLGPQVLAEVTRATEHAPYRTLADEMRETELRLASEDPGEVKALLSSDEALLVAAGLRLAGQLGLVRLSGNVADRTRHEDPEVRIAAVQALVALGRGQMADSILRLIEEDPEPDVREAAARGMLTLHPASVADGLVDWVERRAFRTRPRQEQILVLQALARVAPDRALPILDELLNGRRWLVLRYPTATRTAAARALAHVEGEDARSILRAAEEAGAGEVRAVVRYALRGAGTVKTAEDPRRPEAGDGS